MASKISGAVFIDQNADGSEQGGDASLSGVTVSLLDGTGKVLNTAMTDANGNYVFDSLSNGTYYIAVAQPNGDLFSAPGSSATLPNSVVSSTGRTSAITLAGSDVTGQNAGIYAPVSLSGTVFADANDDGLVNGTDKGQAGVTVQLLDGQGKPTGQAAITAADGTYSFKNLAPGTYSVHVVMPTLPPGGVFSQKGSNTAPQPTGGTTAATQNLLVNGSFDNGLTQTGNFSTAQGYVGWTLSGNSASQPYGSGPGKGPEIAWTNGVNAVAIDPSGGTNPYAGVVSPDAANPYYDGGSGYHAAYFVDDGAIETLSQTVTLSSGQIYEIGFDLNETTPGRNNPGYFQLTAAIGGKTIVTAGSTSGTILTPGVWTHFADLYTPAASGTYTLTFTYSSGVPGSTLTSKDVLVDDVYVVPGQVTPNLTTTSQVDADGNTNAVTLTSGQTVGNESAGIYLPPATITGTVFADANADGVKGIGDAGLAGRTVNLSAGPTVVATTVTDANGSYGFANLAAGSYTVQIVAPAGNSFSPVSAAAGQVDSTVNPAGNASVTVANGGAAVVNGGLYAPATLRGTVFNDANADGARQSGDGGLAGQTVTLLTSDAARVVATATTNGAGAYSFTNLLPGSYVVQITAMTGDVFSPAGSNASLPDSGVSAAGRAPVTLVSGQSATINAGEYALGTVTGTLFNDLNADGVREAGDAGVTGRTVDLIGAGSAIVATTTTDANGAYSFANVAVGGYTVRLSAPQGEAFSPVGADPSLADSNVAADGTAPVTVVAGGVSTVNAGVWAPPAVTGVVFNDMNADGTLESGDAGLGGQTVTLIAADGATVVATTTTRADGSYALTGTTPGLYTVRVVPAPGDAFSPAGTSALLPNSAVDGNGSVSLFLNAGTNVVNAGEYGAVALGGTVFLDANTDGLDDLGNPVIKGVVANLLNAAGQIVATTTTDVTGHYQFNGAMPGTYQVQFVAPAGTDFTSLDHAGRDPSISSHAFANGVTESVTLAGGANDQDLGAGLVFNTGLHNGSTTVVVPGGTAWPGETTGGSTVFAPGANTNVHGGQGNNFIIAGGANDIVESGQGTDFIQFAGGGVSSANSGAQGLGTRDYIFGGAGGNTLQGDNGSNYLVAGNSASFLAGGVGHNTLIAGPDNGTMTWDGTTLSNVRYGDQIFTGPGVSSVLYQKGDGVTNLPDFNPAKGDTLTIYGYSGFQAVGQANGQTVLYLGPNAGFVLQGSYDQSLRNDPAHLPGIVFVPTGRPTPQLVLEINTLGQPTLIDSGAAVIQSPPPPLSAMSGSGTTGVSTSDPAVSGTTAPNLVVTISNATTVLGTVVADANGTYVFRDAALADGTYHLTASVTDVTGQTTRATTTLALNAAAPVQQAYAQVLGRAADAGGAAAFRALLVAGGTMASMVAQLAGSGEAQSDLNGLYQAVLGRSIDPAGLAGWQALLANGTPLNAIRAALAGTQEARNAIGAAYQAELGRNADVTGLANFQALLANGGSLSDIRAALSASGEAQNAIAATYQSELGRGADAGGLANFQAYLAQGGSLANIRVALAASGEAQVAISGLYQTELGRSADAGGLANFQALLSSGGSLADIRNALATSGEAENAISRLYQAELGRGADSGGLASFEGVLANGGSLGGVRGILAGSGEAANAVSALYQIVLGRSGDAGGVAGFQAMLSNGASLSDVRGALATSGEAQADITGVYQGRFAQAPTAAQLQSAEAQLATNTSLAQFAQQIAQSGAHAAGSAPPAGAVAPDVAAITTQTIASMSGSLAGMTIINGTPGDDRLVATSSADLFVLGGGPSGHDEITGFDVSQDMLQIGFSRAAGFAAVQADTIATSGGALLTLDAGSSVLLSGVQPSQLQAGNLHFV